MIMESMLEQGGMVPHEEEDPSVTEKIFDGNNHYQQNCVMDRNSHSCCTTGDDGVEQQQQQPLRTLNFCMLGCEAKVPYGPIDHTAELLLELLGMAALAGSRTSSPKIGSCSDSHSETEIRWKIRIHKFDVQQFQYPTEWDRYDGILVPGSFSSAYDTTEPWIGRLRSVLQKEVVAHQRPTLGVCFGHQILAHSCRISEHGDSKDENDDDGTTTGRAVATPSGPRAGRYSLPLSMAGQQMLLGTAPLPPSSSSSSSIDMYCTHGDMVAQLPDCAVSLGGDDAVPIQAAAYFATRQRADAWRDTNTNTSGSSTTAATRPKPFAITFQAHPEYATSLDLGVFRTLNLCMDAMEQRGAIGKDHRIAAGEDSCSNFLKVQKDSIACMVRVGQLLGWFPC
jgi:GMP synthase-like glutamine amidotransferase